MKKSLVRLFGTLHFLSLGIAESTNYKSTGVNYCVQTLFVGFLDKYKLKYIQ